MRQTLAEFRKQRLRGGVRFAWLACDGKRKREVGLSRDANLAADQPIHMSSKLRGRRRLERPSSLERHGKEDFVLVAEIHQGSKRQALRSRKLHGTRSDACREFPVNLRRLAGIAGIHPVNVPALVENKMQAYIRTPSRLNRASQGNEIHTQVLRSNSSRRR